MFDAEGFFQAVIRQDAAAMRACFCGDARVDWICTNERFTVEEYIRANCEYPGRWRGAVEKCIRTEEGFILAAKVWPEDESASFHAVSFVSLRDGRIASMEEYWADDGPPPEWRQRMQIGRPIETCSEDKKREEHR